MSTDTLQDDILFTHVNRQLAASHRERKILAYRCGFC